MVCLAVLHTAKPASLPFQPFAPSLSQKESPSATNGNKGTMSRGSTLLEKESPFPASFMMITESPWRIRPAPRWSSFASCQAVLSKYNPLCDISHRTVLINAFTCELLYHFKRKSQAVSFFFIRRHNLSQIIAFVLHYTDHHIFGRI